MAKRKRYYVEAVVKVLSGVEIMASSLDDALEKAKEMDLGDFVDIKGDHNDSEYELRGVFQSGGID